MEEKCIVEDIVLDFIPFGQNTYCYTLYALL